MGNDKEIAIKFTLNDNITSPIAKIAKAFGKTEKAAKSTQRSFNSACRQMQRDVNAVKNSMAGWAKIGAAFGVSAGAVMAFGKNCVTAASDMQETISKVDVTFKSSSNAIKEWSKTSLEKMGLARQSAMDTAALYGDMGSGMGLSSKKIAEMSMRLTQLSADLSSYKNISQEQAKNALKGVFTGETEALKNIGTTMTQATLQEYAYSIGIKKKISKMKEAEKVMLRYQYVLYRNKNADGDYFRTGGGWANQFRSFTEAQKELSEQLGEAFLPKMTQSLTRINTLFKAEMPNIVKKATPIFNGFATAVEYCVTNMDKIIKTAKVLGLVFAGFQVLSTFVTTVNLLKDTFGLLGGAIKLATFGLRGFMMLGAAGLVITGIVLVIQHWEQISEAIDKATKKMKEFLHIKERSKGLDPTRYTEIRAKHASGTSGAVGGLALVGERGAELVNLPTGAKVSTAEETKKAIGGNITLNLNIAGNVIGNQEFINHISNVLGRQLQVALAR